MEAFSIGSTVRRYPKLPYQKIKDGVLGKKYAVSLVFVGPRRAQVLNRRFRNKKYVPNVLAFPLSKSEGEVFITPIIAAKEAKARGMSERAYTGFLFIHALLHLKGHTHGAKMEKAEAAYMKEYRLM